MNARSWVLATALVASLGACSTGMTSPPLCSSYATCADCVGAHCTWCDGTCTPADRCDSGFMAVIASECASASCHPLGTTCRSSYQCCAGLECTQLGECQSPAPHGTCSLQNEPCRMDSDCCDGMTCNALGSCGPIMNGCSSLGLACIDSIVCCPGLGCVDGFCASAPPRMCSVDNEPCDQSHVFCCGTVGDCSSITNSCEGGSWLIARSPCLRDVECCGTGRCVNGACTAM